jgi:hypothetical protein
VNLRLEELYRRYLSLHDEIVGYYDSGLGNNKPERSAEAEQESFAICQATTESEWSRAVTPRRPSSSTCGSALAARAVPDDPARQGHQAPGAGSLIPRLRNACRNARETVAPSSSVVTEETRHRSKESVG